MLGKRTKNTRPIDNSNDNDQTNQEPLYKKIKTQLDSSYSSSLNYNNYISPTLLSGDGISICLGGDGSVSAWGNTIYDPMSSKYKKTRPPLKLAVEDNFIIGISYNGNSESVLCLNDKFEVFSIDFDRFRKNAGKTPKVIGVISLNSTIPIEIPNSVPIKQISSGNLFSILISDQGDVFSFGLNSNGSLGIGERNEEITIDTPRKIKTLSNISYAEVSTNGSVICKSFDNKFYGWGNGNYGKLPLGIPIKNFEKLVVFSPYVCEGIPKDVVSFKLAGMFSIFLTSNKDVYICGSHRFHTTPIQDYDPSNLVKINNIPEILKISVGSGHAMLIDINNNLLLFGSNFGHQLGIKNYSFCDDKLIEHKYLRGITDLSWGGQVTIVKTFDDDVYAFGNNENAEIANIKRAKSFISSKLILKNELRDIWKTTEKKNKQKSARK